MNNRGASLAILSPEEYKDRWVLPISGTNSKQNIDSKSNQERYLAMNTNNTNFMGMMSQTLANQPNSVTENGALGHKTTGKALVDLNFAIASMRGKTDSEIVSAFLPAYAEDPVLAMKYLFFARDARGGLGERRFFRVVSKWFADNHRDDIRKYLPLIPEYGRWDDLVELISDPVLFGDVVDLISKQLKEDWNDMKHGASISLLAKWLPSVNTSSPETVRKARGLLAGLHMTERQYRKMLSKLRAYLKVVETKMSANQWNEIDYEAVPSKANLVYKDAFMKHDEERRKKYLESLSKGETKINASVAYPYDIVHKYHTNGTSIEYANKDDTLEGMWKALPTPKTEFKPMIVVADGSGSMQCGVGGTGVSALDVANSLAIYFAERLPGPFANKYITFSHSPQYVNFGSGTSLLDKIKIAEQHNEVANTNIKAVFEMILKTALDNKLEQKDIPDILIISDMEFDGCVIQSSQENYWDHGSMADKTLFQTIAEEYEDAGYKIPKVVFWNVNSRTGTIPMNQNELGCALVSGFSPSIADMVMSTKLDPYEILLDKLNSPRYDLDKNLERMAIKN